MNVGTILGVGILILGVFLLGFAYHSTDAPIEQFSNTLTGRYTDNTMWYIFAGGVAVVSGILLVAFGKRI